MHDKKFEDYLILYHYGELETGLKEEFSAHLRDCPECRGELVLLEEIDGKLHKGTYSPSQKIIDRVFDLTGIKPKINLSDYVKSGFLKRFYKPAAAFAAVVLLIIGFNFYKKPALPEDLWFGGLDSEIELLSGSINDLRVQLSTDDYLMDSEMDKIEEMLDMIEISI
jgi:hypothetical protein